MYLYIYTYLHVMENYAVLNGTRQFSLHTCLGIDYGVRFPGLNLGYASYYLCDLGTVI